MALKRLAGCAAKNRFYRANRDLGRVNKTEVGYPLHSGTPYGLWGKRTCSEPRAEHPVQIAFVRDDGGVGIEERAASGDTPLHRAALFNKNPAVITALLDAGADPKARNADGMTPWDCAKDNEALKGSDAYWRLNDARF